MTDITIHDYKGQRVIDARELHSFLESGQDFSTWIKGRIQKYGFVKNVDYSSFHKTVERDTGATKRIEYALTLDTAKEIAMVEGNERGRQARRYFIECERKTKVRTSLDFSNPDTVLQLAQNWAESERQRIAAEAKIKTLQPKADLMDRIIDCDDMVDIGQVAKILQLPYGRNTLFRHLRAKGILFQSKNEPKQQYVNAGYFQLREKFIERKNHDSFVVIKVLVTQRGLEYLSKIFNIIPSSSKLAAIS